MAAQSFKCDTGREGRERGRDAPGVLCDAPGVPCPSPCTMSLNTQLDLARGTRGMAPFV